MFSIIGASVANAVLSVSLLSPAEAIAASSALVFSIGGLVLLAWLTREPLHVETAKSGSRPSFKKAA